MRDPAQTCLTETLPDARVVKLVPASTPVDRYLGSYAAYLAQNGFRGEPGQLALLPGAQGVDHAVFVVPDEDADAPRDACPFGTLATDLPEGDWSLDFEALPERSRISMAEDAVLGFCMGAYRFVVGEQHPATVRLVLPESARGVLALARANWLGRDLINTPANLLGPRELADAARNVLEQAGAHVAIVQGSAMESAYPCLSAVAAGSDRPGQVVVAEWRGSRADDNAPLLSLVGKGVCFDTGGYDIKPASGMLRMKKDMGGAALMLAVALVAIAADLPVRLELRLGCVENSISGHAMRPGDVLQTRAGLTVEVGNTDAEGRLVLCDLLAEACEADPTWLMDAATLTGAARVALGPDLPALFCNDEAWSETILEAARSVSDAMWRLPLWYGYNAWLRRKVATIGNVTDKPMAGAITAALFLQKFVKPQVKWAHIDTYAWNDSSFSGRPEGGETLGLRGIHTMLLRMINA